jgi:hypothetical protein
MANEACEKILAAAQTVEFPLHSPAKFVRIRGSEVREARELGVIPHTLIRIQLRRIRREAVSSDFYVASQVLSYKPSLVVNVAPVPNDIEGSLDLATQVSQELDNVISSHVSVGLEQTEVEAEPAPLGAQRDRADGGDPIVAIPALLDGRLSTRRKRASHERRQHEA